MSLNVKGNEPACLDNKIPFPVCEATAAEPKGSGATCAHEGHRGKLRKKYLNFGLESLQEHEMLELLLFGAIPRVNVNEIAHRLYDRFDRSLLKLFRATPEMLLEVNGIGEQSAVLIKLFGDLHEYLEKETENESVYNSPAMWFKYFQPRFSGARYEKALMLCLDSRYKLIRGIELGSGTAKSATIDMRGMIKEALWTDACYVVLAHNHMNGLMIPSAHDKTATSLAKQALQSIEVTLLDHLIVCGGEYECILNPRRTI